MLPARLFSVPKTLLLARIADHFDRGNLHVSVLGITLLHTCILGHFLGVFLHIVKLHMGDNAGCSNRVTHMFGKGYSAASHFPCAPILYCQPAFRSAASVGPTAC